MRKLLMLSFLTLALSLGFTGCGTYGTPEDAKEAREVRETQVKNPVIPPAEDKEDPKKEKNNETDKKGETATPAGKKPEAESQWTLVFPEHAKAVDTVKQLTQTYAKLSDAEFKVKITDLAKKPTSQGGLGLEGEKLASYVKIHLELEDKDIRGFSLAYEELAYAYALRPIDKGGLGLNSQKAQEFVLTTLSSTPGGFAVEFVILHQKAFTRRIREMEAEGACEDCIVFDQDKWVKEATESAWKTLVLGLVSPDARSPLSPTAK